MKAGNTSQTNALVWRRKLEEIPNELVVPTASAGAMPGLGSLDSSGPFKGVLSPPRTATDAHDPLNPNEPARSSAAALHQPVPESKVEHSPAPSPAVVPQSHVRFSIRISTRLCLCPSLFSLALRPFQPVSEKGDESEEGNTISC